MGSTDVWCFCGVSWCNGDGDALGMRWGWNGGVPFLTALFSDQDWHKSLARRIDI